MRTSPISAGGLDRTARRARIDADHRPASDRPAGPAARPVAAKVATAFILAGLLLLDSAVATAAADRNAGPDAADLRHVSACTKMATTRILSVDEAAGCARAFLRIKLSFLPEIGPDDFDRLPLRERAEVNRLGYLRYLEWCRDNAGKVEGLCNAPLTSPDIARN